MAADYSTCEQFAYGYDEVGNRSALTSTTPLSGTVVTTYEYDMANRLTSAGGVPYTWDARGNLINDGTFTYAYNAAGRLVRATNGATTVEYTYNAGGLRVAQSVNGNETTFAWDWASSVPELLRQPSSTRPAESRGSASPGAPARERIPTPSTHRSGSRATPRND